MSEAPLPNDPASRTPTGEIKEPSLTTLEPEKKAETPLIEPKAEPKAEDKKDEGKKDDKSLLNKDEKKDEKKAPEGAPEAYEPFKTPEGYKLDEAVSKEAGDLFKGLGLSQTQAQSLVDFYAKQTQASAEQPYKDYAALREGWQNEVKADPEIGNKLPEVKQNFAKALDSLGDPKLASEFRAAMDLTGAGDHPAFIKVINKFASRMIEGGHVRGSNPSEQGQKSPNSPPPDAAHALYPKLA